MLLFGIEFLNFKLRHPDLGKNTTKSPFEEGNGGRRKTGVGETGRFLEGQCAGRDNTERRKEMGTPKYIRRRRGTKRTLVKGDFTIKMKSPLASIFCSRIIRLILRDIFEDRPYIPDTDPASSSRMDGIQPQEPFSHRERTHEIFHNFLEIF